LVKTFEVVVEEEQVTEGLLTLFLFGSGYDLALFKFFLLLVFIFIEFATTWSIH
jgi:hypothetical protein